MTRIYLIRHGEAEGNIYRRAHGHYDGHITARGLRQIDALAERFKDVPLDELYSSDLSRTKATAGAITRYHDLEMHLESRLREVRMGSWEDIPWGNLSHDFPEQMRAFNDDPDRWYAPGCETFPELRRRMRGIVTELAQKHPDQTIACVSHGMIIRSLVSELLGVRSEEIYKVPHGDNTSVTLLEAEGEALRVVFYNDNSHLPESLSTFAKQSWWRKPGSHDTGNLRFAPLDPVKEDKLYAKLYGETWKAVHGSLEGFNPRPYLAAARRHFAKDPRAVVKALQGDEVVGVTELDMDRGAAEGYGWISLCYVAEGQRRRRLGVQLLGHAVSVFRSLERKTLRLNCFEGNHSAIAFYEEYGFKTIGKTPGVLGDLLLMEKDLT